MLRRFLCLFGASLILFSWPVSAFASGFGISGVEVGLDIASLADMAWKFSVGSGNLIRHLLDEDVCPFCTDLTAQHNFVPKRTQIDGQIGLYYVCSYCGKSAGEVLDNTYEAYVETLPGTTLNSDGSFLWKPAFSDFVQRVIYVTLGSTGCSLSSSCLDYVDAANGCSAKCSVGKSILLTSRVAWRKYVRFSLISPYDGLFTLVTDGYSRSVVNLPFRQGEQCSALESVPSSDLVVTISWPEFLVTPFEALSDFSSETRVSFDVSGDGSAGAYGYVENGQLVQSTVGTIYNETTNVYQNPVTGETKDVSSWTYDYSDRSYTLNTEEGDTVTVTYGDSNVTINEGGDTYNVYYLVEHEDLPEHNYTSSVTLAPTCTGTGVRTYTCTDCGETYTETIPATGHSYQSAVTMPPTCTNTGVRTFTCSACGDSYTASIPATGHTWHVLQNVSTEFDENGQLLREGYTIYQCSACGEQYRITADSGGSSLPSPSSGGTSTGNTDLVEIDSSVGRGFLATIAHGLTEDLPAVLQACSQWFTEFPRFYSGFVAFLTDGVFSCYPAEYKLMMSFGIGMVTIIGIVRKILGR